MMSKRRASLAPWLALFVALVAADYVVPYTLLSDVPKLAGSFLFWVGITTVAILAAFVLSSRWRD